MSDSKPHVDRIFMDPGWERWRCRVKDCTLSTWANVPYGYCKEHLVKHLIGEPMEEEIGFPALDES